MSIYLTKAENYILECIEENLEGETITETSDKVEYLKTRFYSEYGFMIPRYGMLHAAREWLLGLALNTHYTYADICTEYYGLDLADISEDDMYFYDGQYWDALATAVETFVENY